MGLLLPKLNWGREEAGRHGFGAREGLGCDMHHGMSCHGHGGESLACMRAFEQGGHVPGVEEVSIVLHEQRGGSERQGDGGFRHAQPQLPRGVCHEGGGEGGRRGTNDRHLWVPGVMRRLNDKVGVQGGTVHRDMCPLACQKVASGLRGGRRGVDAILSCL